MPEIETDGGEESAAAGDDDDANATDLDVDRWRSELESKRAEKDDFFADHPQSPIPPEEREAFDGLSYFDPDPQYRIRATVSLHDDPESDPVTMDTTAGREMRYLRVATLTFDLERDDPDLENGTLDLHAYQQRVGSDEPLFVPFRDKTTGQQTYEGGRYMELAPERELGSGDEIVVDFNLAYSPFCAYSETFDCPLPPEENWLDVAIPAGERLE